MAQSRSIRIKYLLRNLGIPPHVLGYLYATEAVDYMISKPEKTIFMNEVYSHIASVYLTSEACVEASIRNAVKRASKEKTPFFTELFRSGISIGNHMFLTTLRDIFEEKNLEYINQKLKLIG